MSVHFKRSLKTEYSWLSKGKHIQLWIYFIKEDDQWFQPFLLMESFFELFIENTGNAKKIWDFICILKYAIDSKNMKSNKKWVYVMDNASIHHSYSTIEVFKKLNLCIMFLPVYSPELAAIELLFRLIKNKIRSSRFAHEYSFWNPKEWQFLIVFLILKRSTFLIFGQNELQKPNIVYWNTIPNLS